MDRNKVYEYFAIQNDLKDTIIMWLNKAFHKNYTDIKIYDIKYISGGMISFNVDFITYVINLDDEKKEIETLNYKINIKELENV